VLEGTALGLGYKPKQINRTSTTQLRRIALYEAENDRNAWDNFDGDCCDDYDATN
jgi:hypothetical protein